MFAVHVQLPALFVMPGNILQIFLSASIRTRWAMLDLTEWHVAVISLKLWWGFNQVAKFIIFCFDVINADVGIDGNI